MQLKPRRWAETFSSKSVGDVAQVAYRVLRVVAVVFLGYAAWAQLTPNVWPPSWAMLQKVRENFWWFLVVVSATLVAAFNVAEWLEGLKGGDVTAEQAANHLEEGVHNMRTGLKPKAENEFRAAIDNILMAAQIEIERELGIDGRNLIQVNLAWVKTTDKGKVLVVAARSKPGICPIEYAWNSELMACRAIETNAPVVQCSVRSIPEYKGKKYDCVAVVPIVENNCAYGAITADSRESHTFSGKEMLIDRILRPYAALVLLTRARDADYHECPRRSVR